jgi:hypothetical protein
MNRAFAVFVIAGAICTVGPAKAGHYDTRTNTQTPDCRDWQACRQLALEAADRKEYDLFHDLAWKAVQLGPKNDPALMTLLARAQSLSGRPLDALVMLQRLQAMGVATDALTSDDFARVRALPSWPEFEAKLTGQPAPAAPSNSPMPAATPKPSVTPSMTLPPPVKAEKSTATPPEPPPSLEKPVATAKKTAPTSKAAAPANAPLAFTPSGVIPVGLGYDAVSGRFILGDKADRRLVVVGERSGRLASLAGVDAGFNDVTAFEIDTHEGDLWVVSSSNQPQASTVHKLQLISGRVLTSIALPDEQGPGTFTDVAVTPTSILVLDSAGRRVFRVAKKGRTLELAARIAAPNVSSLAPSSDTTAYAPFDQGILHIDLNTRALTVVEPSRASGDLRGLTWMRWLRGSLVAIQQTSEQAYRLVRIRLDDAGRSVKGVDVIADAVPLAGPTSATISGSVLYYLVRAGGGDQIEVRKATLK